MIQLLGASLFGIVAVLTLLIGLGFPLGEFSIGGKYKVVPPKLRILCWVSLAIQLFAIIVILQAGKIIPLWFSIKTTKYIIIFFAIYLSLNTIMNFLSTSKKEKLYATPLSIIAAICFWITGVEM
ncbi:hypothetical protein SAMN04488542_11294 [Fontibacillus panacisegetis]|uniref:Uncharacterized protein n=2 Tax=Fontibacillus panacisegetis TaxID=670482 RepID=A0A1G7LX41_9BACL|nr:hypothetical protein SAMN04488542_11294 [Fontibacillus panacisegetis]